MIYGYARVSTKGQAKDGNSLEEQKERLIAEGVSEIIYTMRLIVELKQIDQYLMS